MLRSAIVPFLFLFAAGCAAERDLTSEARASGPPAPTKPAPKTRHFELHYEATVKSAPEGSKEVKVWIPVAQDTDFQTVKVTGITAPAGHQVNVEKTLGNKMLHVTVPASSLPLTVRVDYDVVREERRTDLAATNSSASISASDRDRYLAGTDLVPVGAKVTEMSGFKATRSGDPVATAHEIYDHVLAKMKYGKPENKAWGRGSTEYACTEGVGNCTDFHAYFMSLTRTNGVPSRFLMGVSLPTDKTEGEIPGYHCWAEFFADGRGWIPVDISEADKVADKDAAMADFYFGGLTMDRIEFTTGRDVPLVPAAAGGARNFFIYPYCEIDGKEAAKEAIARKFTFKDVK